MNEIFLFGFEWILYSKNLKDLKEFYWFIIFEKAQRIFRKHSKLQNSICQEESFDKKSETNTIFSIF